MSSLFLCNSIILSTSSLFACPPINSWAIFFYIYILPFLCVCVCLTYWILVRAVYFHLFRANPLGLGSSACKNNLVFFSSSTFKIWLVCYLSFLRLDLALLISPFFLKKSAKELVLIFNNGSYSFMPLYEYVQMQSVMFPLNSNLRSCILW